MAFEARRIPFPGRNTPHFSNLSLPLDASEQGILLHQIGSVKRAAEALQHPAFPRIEGHLLTDFAKRLEPALAILPNRNAVSIGCGAFPEAAPWVLVTQSIIHGIDGEANGNYVESYLKHLTASGILSDNEAGLIGYSFSQPFANAMNKEPYLLDEYGQFGVAFLRHPEIRAPGIHFQEYNTTENVYPSITSTLLSDVIAVGGIVYLTFHELADESHYLAILEPYIKAGIIQPGIQGENTIVCIPEEGIAEPNHATTGDNYVRGFRKVREIPVSERQTLLQQSTTMWHNHQDTGNFDPMWNRFMQKQLTRNRRE